LNENHPLLLDVPVQTDIILRILLLVALLIIPMIPTFWAIRDVARSRFPSLTAKAVWFVVVTLLPVLGALAYIIAGRPRKEDKAAPPSWP
jgi:hypothetical protein